MSNLDAPDHALPAEEGPYEGTYFEGETAELEPRQFVNRSAISPKVGVPAFVAGVYAAVIATLFWIGVAIPEDVVLAWGAVITLASGYWADRD